LEPNLALRGLLRGENLDKTLAEAGADVAVVRLGEVAVERRGVELREAVHLVNIRVDAVRDRDVDEAVVRAEGDRGLRALLRERVEARARATAEDDREDVVRAVIDDLARRRRGRGGLGRDSLRGASDLRGSASLARGEDGLAADGLAGACERKTVTDVTIGQERSHEFEAVAASARGRSPGQLARDANLKKKKTTLRRRRRSHRSSRGRRRRRGWTRSRAW